MKKHAVALLLTGLSCAAMASWVKVAEDTDTVGYYDPATLARAGNVLTVTELNDFKRPATTSTDRVFRSARSQRQYDCVAGRMRTVSLAPFEGQMGDGRALDVPPPTSDWVAVVPGSTRADTLHALCSR
jgi:hypothetical protein